MNNGEIAEQNTNATQQDTSLYSVVGKISAMIADVLAAGELAGLRRSSSHEPFTPALWKVLLSCVPDRWTEGSKRDERELQWAALLTGMAICKGLHNPSLAFGKALATAGWSELRFVRLMKARDEKLSLETRRVAVYLASKMQEANWTDIANLLLDQKGEWAERHRRRIARDYYAALYRLNKQEQE